MNKRVSRFVNLCPGLFVLLAGLFFFSSHALAQGGAAPRVQGRLDDTILHVDRYGVYVAKRVLYWDSTLPKQKVDALIKAAERLRNKKATIVYSAQENIDRDRHPLVADIVPFKDEGPASAPPPSQEARPSKVEPVASKVEPAAPKVEPPAPSAPAAPDVPSRQASAPADSPPAARPARQEPPAKEPAVSASVTPQQAPMPRKIEGSPATPSASTVFSRERVLAFVQHLLALNERKDLTAILAYYGDQVDYYDRGVVTRDYIKRDMGYYFRNWDTIHSTLDGDVVVIVTDEPDVRIVKYVSSYAVENSRKAVSGRTENIWKIQRSGEDWKIIGVKQQRVASEAR